MGTSKEAKEVDLGSGSVGKLLFNLAIPAITAQIINVLYNMVDRMYIGHLPGVGANALTGVGVTFPVDVYKRQNMKADTLLYVIHAPQFTGIPRPPGSAFCIRPY